MIELKYPKKLMLKIDGSLECIVWRQGYFLNMDFRFQSEACNGCHDLMQKAMIFSDVAIGTVKGND